MKKLLFVFHLVFLNSFILSAQQAFPTQMEGEYLCEPRFKCNSFFKILVEKSIVDSTRFLIVDSCPSIFSKNLKMRMNPTVNDFGGVNDGCTTQGTFYPNKDSIFARRSTPGCGSGCTCGLEYKCKKITTSIFEKQLKAVQLYPNPVKEELLLKGSSEKIVFRLHNIQGQIIKSGVISSQQPLKMSGLPPGIYTLQLGEGKQQVWKKVVKE